MRRIILWILIIIPLLVLATLVFWNKPQSAVEVQPTAILVFFGNTKNDPNVLDCSVTYSVSRQVVLGDDKYSAVLAELLQGPSETETSAGFFTSINPGLELPKITFLNGTLTVDFAPALEVGVGGSCRVLFIRSQIIDTLKQFPEVKEVVISIDGRVDDILQP